MCAGGYIQALTHSHSLCWSPYLRLNESKNTCIDFCTARTGLYIRARRAEGMGSGLGAASRRAMPSVCSCNLHAQQIAEGVKTFEGRPGGGWLEPLPQANDYINFRMNCGRRQVVRMRRACYGLRASKRCSRRWESPLPAEQTAYSDAFR